MMTAMHLPTGKGRMTFRDPVYDSPPMRVWYYHPSTATIHTPIVFVMHGTKRDAAVYRDTWAEAAVRYGFLVVCPEFDTRAYPGWLYHIGNLTDQDGHWRTHAAWSFVLIERLFDHIVATTGNTSTHYGIYGHSAGAQFVHRMALFMPEARFQIGIAANAGWYTMPTFESSRFPYSLKQTTLAPEALARAFNRRLCILLGAHDNDPDDARLRQSPRAQRQGPHRLARGHAFYEQALSTAAQLRVPLRWKLATVAGAGHNDLQMMPVAAAALSAALAPKAHHYGGADAHDVAEMLHLQPSLLRYPSLAAPRPGKVAR